VESQKERDHWEDLDVDGRILLKWILEKRGGVVFTRFMCQDSDPWLTEGAEDNIWTKDDGRRRLEKNT
jgi:hypothetical protein